MSPLTRVLPFLLLLGLVACDEPGRSDAPAPAPDPAPAPASAPSTEKSVFDSPLAGSWYDADAVRLGTDLDGFLTTADETGPRVNGVRALVLPHAGYRYSGRVAAHGLRHVAGRAFDRVIVMGPSHRWPLENVVSVPHVTHYATPLGEVALDHETIAALERYPEFQHVPRAHAREHSVQIQVPLLQRYLASFRLVPLVVGDLDAETTRRVAAILSAHVDDRTLVIASTDFTHYGERFGYVPFEDDVEKRLEALDLGAFAKIEALDAEGFAAYVQSTGATICGRRPVEILLRMLPTDARITRAKYDTSGRTSGDWQTSVSYLSAFVRTTWPKREEPPVDTTPLLTPEEKAALLALARGALARALEGQGTPTPEALGVEITKTMGLPCGAFVTLRNDGALRGCIGEIHASRPLWRSVMGTAVGAALNDHRFRSVTAEELDALDLHISVLSPPRPVPSWEHIELGRHGIVLEKHGRTATFLPQVAPEQGWDLDTTLTMLAQKAGLAADAWHEGARLLVFEAQVFGDGELDEEGEGEHDGTHGG